MESGITSFLAVVFQKRVYALVPGKSRYDCLLITTGESRDNRARYPLQYTICRLPRRISLQRQVPSVPAQLALLAQIVQDNLPH